MPIFDDPKKAAEREAIDSMIIREAQDLGLLDDNGRELLLESEAVGRNVRQVREMRERKLGTLAERACIFTAQEKGDPLFQEWVEARTLVEAAGRKIRERYSPSVRNRVKDSLRQAKTLIRGGQPPASPAQR
jgi:hypothetical protein